MSRDVSSMDAETTSHSSKDSRRATLQDGVAATPVAAVEDEFDSQFLSDDLNAVLNTLEPRERNVLRMHFGLVGNGRAMTLVDVGATYGLSRERVRQIEDIAFRKLRSPQRSKTLLRHMASGGAGVDPKAK
jgi:RNA polymerase primary sigma factor